MIPHPIEAAATDTNAIAAIATRRVRRVFELKASLLSA
jgi:hypothetical protein